MKGLNLDNITAAVGGRLVYPEGYCERVSKAEGIYGYGEHIPEDEDVRECCEHVSENEGVQGNCERDSENEGVQGNCERGSENEGVHETATSVVLDSRKIEQGSIFVATVGEKVDGHSFIPQVFEKGALGCICEKLPEVICGPCILVDNSFDALKKLAKFYREQMKDIRIVGIVGSVGKTSTKELVASVLEQHFCTLKTEGNFNNEVGVPLTILRLRDEHEVAVVEMGINHFGEMDRLGDIVKPDAVVMTNIGHAHLENLIDLDGVLKAKSEVFSHIKPGGMLVLNSEDEKLNTVQEDGAFSIVRYGKGGDVWAEDIRSLGLEGSEFKVCSLDGACFDATVHLTGIHMVMNSLAATAVGRRLGMNSEEIARGIAAAKPVSGRSNLIRTERYLVVDDCYNGNPKSDEAAIDLMKDALGRKCAILGDMFELGENTAQLHAGVGEYAVMHGIELLVCVGELSRNMYEAAVAKNTGASVKYFAGRDELLENIEGIGFKVGDTILVKASHGMGFAKVVEELVRNS